MPLSGNENGCCTITCFHAFPGSTYSHFCFLFPNRFLQRDDKNEHSPRDDKLACVRNMKPAHLHPAIDDPDFFGEGRALTSCIVIWQANSQKIGADIRPAGPDAPGHKTAAAASKVP